MKDWIDNLFSNEAMLHMGHFQRGQDSNLGLGWIYYGLVRVIRPQTVVSIGSWRGFVPMVLAKALKDNNEGGKLLFIDPSLVDDFWQDEQTVREYFLQHDLDNITHFHLTTEEFTKTSTYETLSEIGLLFVDGFHDAEHARFDFESFKDKLGKSAITIFHDSVREFITGMYGKDGIYTHDVFRYLEELKADPNYQVMDFPFDSGMTLVRQVTDPNDPAFSPRIGRKNGSTNTSNS